jgi:hypothetical protein
MTLRSGTKNRDRNLPAASLIRRTTGRSARNSLMSGHHFSASVLCIAASASGANPGAAARSHGPRIIPHAATAPLALRYSRRSYVLILRAAPPRRAAAAPGPMAMVRSAVTPSMPRRWRAAPASCPATSNNLSRKVNPQIFSCNPCSIFLKGLDRIFGSHTGIK